MVLWLVVSVLVALSILVTTLRIALPQLNQFQPEIKSWVRSYSGFDFAIANVSGTWRNNHPSIALQGLRANLPNSPQVHFAVDEIRIELDLWQSLITLQPVVADLTMDTLTLDLQSLDLWQNQSRSEHTQTTPRNRSPLIKQLDDLLLRQLEHFTLRDGQITYRAVSGEVRQLDIDRLRWQNRDDKHYAEGVVSIVDADLNALSVSAQFVDHGSLFDVTGDFYIDAQRLSITPWLTESLQQNSGIRSGQLSLQAWLTLENSQPKQAYVNFLPSQLVWQREQEHQLALESGVLKLVPFEQGLKVSGHLLKLSTDGKEWPAFDLAFVKPQTGDWQLNVSPLHLEYLAPLTSLLPDSDELSQTLRNMAPKGVLGDVRVAMGETLESLRYSAQFSQVAAKDWQLLPGVSDLSGWVSGSLTQGLAHFSLLDAQVPYAEVFQAPLAIKLADANIAWQKAEDGWRLWGDKLQVATPDLQAIGAFRLDFPQSSAPFLSFYAEADLFNAGETWRYLPVPALGVELTDYLSSAIQGGQVDGAKLLWYGALDQFPYLDHSGMFQAWVELENAKFSFDTAWPTITELQLDLLFQNDAMYLDSRSAQLNGVTAKRITGRIPELAENGHIEIEAEAFGPGVAVRNYMMATPLVDSVGAALTALKVTGEVDSAFNLYIPFDGVMEPRAWGYADLKHNQVAVESPPMLLQQVSGRIRFDDDVVSATGLEATLLSQPIHLGFNGRSVGDDYDVAIEAQGDWAVGPLAPYIGEHWVAPLSGHAPWQMGIDLQLDDVGFTYQIDVSANLQTLASDYPYPLNKVSGDTGKARLQASGNQEHVTARLQLPLAKYQTEIDIRHAPVMTASHLVLGTGSFRPAPLSGHQAVIRTSHFDLGAWLDTLQIGDEKSTVAESSLDELSLPSLPLPTRVTIDTPVLKMDGVEWNDVQFSARCDAMNWLMEIDSQQVEGQARYLAPYDLAVSLSRLHLRLPQFDEQNWSQQTLKKQADEPEVSTFDRQLFADMPNLTLNIEDFWLQGYKVGEVNLVLERDGDSLNWQPLRLSSGSNTLESTGSWSLSSDSSQTQMSMTFSGKNNSDLMERFGVTSGIQKAPFDIRSDLSWRGTPWSMQVDTLNGKMTTEFGKGVISDISGAAKLLGLFSLDSIIRKMQLDFTDVFDQGMAFNSITGTGQIRDGVFFTHDIVMDALAGEMTIQGLADLNDKLVDAQVQFSPDLTSGLPTLTAFAVAPHAALYVFAISTVIAPVVEVFTQVNYQVSGPLDAPTVSEISRSRSEYELPAHLRPQEQGGASN
nr:YhdP family protein [Vibrio agarilyticus]